MHRSQARVALVNAPPYSVREPRYDTPQFTRLSLAALAGHLRSNGFDQLLLIDAKYEQIGYEEIDRRLRKFRPDVVGHTAFTNEIIQAAHVATGVRALSRELGKPIVNVVGGPHCSALPVRTLDEFPQFDVAVAGQGEATLLELVQHLSRAGDRASLERIDGIAFRDGATADVVVTRPRSQTTPGSRPAWDLLPPSPVATVMTARGCPFACNFCQNPNGRRVRKRGVQDFLDEVRWLVDERGTREFIICDEILTVDKSRTHAILDGLIEMGFGRDGLTFEAQTHVNCVDEALLRKIDRAGCNMLGFGLETGDPETLRSMGKGTDPEGIAVAIAQAKRAGVALGTFFILGQPHETWRSALNTVNQAIASNPQLPMFGLMVPYPGTQVWEWANRGERGYALRSHDWNDYNKQVGDALEFKGISRRSIEFLRLYGYSMVFLRNRRPRDFAAFVWRYRVEGLAVLGKIIAGDLNRFGGPRPYATEIDGIARTAREVNSDARPLLHRPAGRRRLKLARESERDAVAAPAAV